MEAGAPSPVSFAEVVKRYIEAGGDIERKDQDGLTLLLKAVAAEDADAVEALIAQGANLKATEGMGWNAVHLAALRNNTELLDILAKAGANIEHRNLLQETPLMVASGYCYDKFISRILSEHNAKVFVVDWKGCTPLVLAKKSTKVHGDQQASIAALEKAMEQAQPRPSYREHLTEGDQKLERKDYLGAAQDYTKAIEIDETVAALYLKRGICLSKLALHNETVTDAIRSITIDPSHTEAHILCVNAYKNMNKWKDAFATLSEAKALFPGNEELSSLEEEVKTAQENAKKTPAEPVTAQPAGEVA